MSNTDETVHLIVGLSFVLYLLLVAVVTRAYYLLVLKNERRPRAKSRNDTTKTMIVLGSGGHTTEMLNLVAALDKSRYRPRHYVIANTDRLSLEKIDQFEGPASGDSFCCTAIGRSREVHQSYFSSLFTTFFSIIRCLSMVFMSRPDVILCNGPGTCVPVCLSAILLRICFINTGCKIVFVESFCRTETLSLTGKILRHVTNLFIVQWPALAEISEKFKYIGNLNFEVGPSENEKAGVKHMDDKNK